MLAGWMTLEARLATAFVLLLVFAAGILPARRVEAAPVQVVANSQGSPARPLLARGMAIRVSPASLLPARETRRQPGDEVTPPAEPTAELDLLNRDRVQAGLPLLAASASLDQVAAIRASQLVADGITHYRPGHQVLAAVELLQASGIPYLWHGENIIWEGGMPQSQVPAFFNTWWMASPSHRDNILDPHYRSVGIGVARNGNAVYMVEVFTDQPGDSAAPSLPAPPGDSITPYRARSRQATSPR
jgi:uncharacterized protein YkwD